MADNQITNARRQAETDQKDDDPFAELARIVGFEDDKDQVAPDEATTEAPSETVAGETVASEPVPQEIDAGLDLEAELLRELEIDVAEDGGSPVEQTALPESTLSVASGQDADVNAPSPSGPNFFDTPDEAPSEPAFLNMDSEPDVSAAAAKPDTVPGGAWPAAAAFPIGSPATSLEAELQAAFSALEDSGSGSAAAIPEPSTLQSIEPVLPTEPLQESEELASAYRSFEENIEAAIPQATPAQTAMPETAMPQAAMPDVAPVDDSSLDVNDLLLAEMIDVEAEAADAVAPSHDAPFDPASITNADDIPETMADLDVPEFEPDEIMPAASVDPDFGLPLEEELEALASEASGVHRDQTEPYRYSTGPEEMLEEELEGIGDDLDVTADTDESALLAADDLDEFSEDTFEDYDDVPLDDDGEFAIDDDDLSVPEYDAIVESDHSHSNRRGLVAAAAVVGIVVVGGAGFYLWNSSLGGDAGAGGPRVIAADSEPVKIKPDSPGGKTVPNQDLAVYDKVAGTESGTPSQQNLVNTTEEPVDVVQRTLDPDTLPLEGRAEGADANGKSEDRLAASEGTEANNGAAIAETNGISPRKVRTLVVKPDGTIVARETPAAATQTGETGVAASGASATIAQPSSESLATDGNATRTVALAPANSTAPADNATPVTTTPAADSTQVASTSPTQNAGASALTGEDASLPPIEADLRNTGAVPVPGSKPGGQSSGAQAVASTGADTSQPAATAPVPSARPAEQPVNIVEAVNERGNLAGSAPADNPGGYVMQISSQPSEAGAQESYRNLSRRYASIIGDRGVSIQRANIANRGVFYRVRIPAGSKAEATSLCNQYKAAGGSCFVAR